MAETLPNIKIQSDEINHSPNRSNLTRGLAINGTTWSVEHDGAANFTSLKINNETLDINKNFDDRYVQLTGGNISGDITTSNTVFNDNSLITKTYVDSAISTLSGDIDLSLFIPNEGNNLSGTTLDLTRSNFRFIGTGGSMYVQTNGFNFSPAGGGAPLIYAASDYAPSAPAVDIGSVSTTVCHGSSKLIMHNGYGKAYYLNRDNLLTVDGREIAVKADFDGYIPNEGNVKNVDFTLQRNKITLKSNTYIETDSNVYNTLKGKTSLNSGTIYLELLDSPTYGTWNSQLGINVETGIIWSRNHLKGNSERYETTVELKDNGYLVHTTDTTNNLSDIINLYSGGLNLENNRVTDTQHNRGQVVLSTKSGLFVSKRDNNNNETHQLNLDCADSNTAQLFLRVNDGVNKWVRLNLDGLTFGGTDIAVESLYFNKDGIGYTTKEANNRKTTYYLTSSATNISYKNQSETGTLTFKPATIDGEVQFKIANTIDDTTHSVTIYNGHTSTTQTEFNSNDYVTKDWVINNGTIDDDPSIKTYLKIYNTEATKDTNYFKIYSDKIIHHIGETPESDYLNYYNYLMGNDVVISASNIFTGIACISDLEGNAVPKVIVSAQDGLNIINNNNNDYIKLGYVDNAFGLNMQKRINDKVHKCIITENEINLNNPTGRYNSTTCTTSITLNAYGLNITKDTQQLIQLSNSGLKFGTNEWNGLTINNDASKLLLYRVNGTVMLSNQWLRISNASAKASTWLGPTHFQIGGDGGGLSGSNTDFNIDMSYGTDTTDDCTATFRMRNHSNDYILKMTFTPDDITVTDTMLSSKTTVESFTDDNEFVTKLYVDNHTPDLSDYVSKAEYNELVEKYNDLVERLNDFLDDSGPAVPEPEYTFVTVPTNSVSITMNQNMDNAFSIDWGDGSEVILSGSHGTDSYGHPNDFTLTHTYETEEVQHINILPVEPYNELCTGEITNDTDDTQFTEIHLENLSLSDYMSGNDTITKCSINNWLNYFGCGAGMVNSWSKLTEFRFGNKWQGVECFYITDCPALEKLVLDFDHNFILGKNISGSLGGDYGFLTTGDSVKEIHCTSEDPFTIVEDGWFREADYEYGENYKRVPKQDLSDLTIYVPANAVNKYKCAAGWEKYSQCIQPEPGTVKTRHTLVTVPTNSVSITMHQYMDDAFSIDWGDGSPIEKTGSHGTDQWEYPNDFTLTHNYATEEIHYIDIIPNDINNELCNAAITYDTDLTQFTEMDLENIDPPTSGNDNTTITKLSMNMPKSFMGSGAPGISGYIGLNEIKYGDRFVEMVYNYITIYGNNNNPKIILGMNKDIVFYYSDLESCLNIIDCDNENPVTEIHCTSKVPFNLAGFNGEQVFLRSIDYDWVDSGAVPKQDLSDLTIYVPAESVNAYKAASSWAPYINCIQAEPES